MQFFLLVALFAGALNAGILVAGPHPHVDLNALKNGQPIYKVNN